MCHVINTVASEPCMVFDAGSLGKSDLMSICRLDTVDNKLHSCSTLNQQVFQITWHYRSLFSNMIHVLPLDRARLPKCWISPIKYLNPVVVFAQTEVTDVYFNLWICCLGPEEGEKQLWPFLCCAYKSLQPLEADFTTLCFYFRIWYTTGIPGV